MVLHRGGSAAGFTACASSNLALSASTKIKVRKIKNNKFFIFLTLILNIRLRLRATLMARTPPGSEDSNGSVF